MAAFHSSLLEPQERRHLRPEAFTMSLLSLTNVSKHFGDVKAVDGVTFSVDRGQVVGFLGPNGAGKSTTMRMINQFFEPDEGEIEFDGVPLTEAARHAKRRIGYLPENNPVYGDMLVTDYLGFIADLRRLSGRERAVAIDAAVDATGVATVFYRPIGELSKGFRQRVGLAQAILDRPDLLVLDEPTEGLDPNQRLEIRRLIEELGKDHTVILSTHVLSEVHHTCSRLLVIHEGRIAADGPVDQLVAQAEGKVQIAVEASGTGVAEGLGAIEGVETVGQVRERNGRVSVSVTADGVEDVRPAIFDLAKANGWTLYELHQETRSLEALFQELTTGSDEA
jgi:ABC-2 type transport system ATP-binding protein